MKTLTRYVVLEVAKVFTVSLIALTLLWIVGGVLREAAMHNVPLTQVVHFIPYILPDALRFSVPVTLLLATTTVYGQLAGSNEVVAAKSLGISPRSLILPTYVVAFVLSLFTIWLNDLAVSWGRTGVQRVIVDAAEEIAYSMLRTQRRYSSPNVAINVKKVDGRDLVLPTISIQARGRLPAMTITARKAELRTDHEAETLKIIFQDAKFDGGEEFGAEIPEIWEQEIPLRDASRTKDIAKTPSCLPLRVIPEETVTQRNIISRLQAELAAEASYHMLTGDFGELTGKKWDRRERELRDAKSRLYRLLLEPHRRCSAGFSCFCFAWVGVPMAIYKRKSDFLTSFFLCFLPILIVYYPLLMYGIDGAKGGTIPPQAIWVGNLLLLVWGMFLLRKVIRY